MPGESHRLDLKSDSIFDRIVLGISTVLFLLTIVFATLQILARNVFPIVGIEASLFWTEPASRMVLVVGSFWGAAVASRNREHIVIRFPLKRVREESETLYQVLRVFIMTVVIAYSFIVFYGMALKVDQQWHTTFTGLEWAPGGVFYLSVAIALLLMAVYEVLNATEEFEFKERVLELVGRNRGDPE